MCGIYASSYMHPFANHLSFAGQHEAIELRDGDKTKWGGKGQYIPNQLATYSTH